eukprot:44048_1
MFECRVIVNEKIPDFQKVQIHGKIHSPAGPVLCLYLFSLVHYSSFLYLFFSVIVHNFCNTSNESIVLLALFSMFEWSRMISNPNHRVIVKCIATDAVWECNLSNHLLTNINQNLSDIRCNQSA